MRFLPEPLCTLIETKVNKFAISNHTALKLNIHALKGCMRLICEHSRTR